MKQENYKSELMLLKLDYHLNIKLDIHFLFFILTQFEKFNNTIFRSISSIFDSYSFENCR